jgi:hypothetical protein
MLLAGNWESMRLDLNRKCDGTSYISSYSQPSTVQISETQVSWKVFIYKPLMELSVNTTRVNLFWFVEVQRDVTHL